MPENPFRTGTVQLYAYEDIPATVTTHRLACMNEVRDNLRRRQIERTGKLVGTPGIDTAIAALEDQLAAHLAKSPEGLL